MASATASAMLSRVCASAVAPTNASVTPSGTSGTSPTPPTPIRKRENLLSSSTAVTAQAAIAKSPCRRLKASNACRSRGSTTGKRKTSAKRAALPNRVMTDRRGGFRKYRAGGAHDAARGDFVMARHCADHERVALAGDAGELRHRVEIDDMCRLRKAHVHHRCKALSSSDDLGVESMQRKKRQRLLERARPVIRKYSGFHALCAFRFTPLVRSKMCNLRRLTAKVTRSPTLHARSLSIRKNIDRPAHCMPMN